ncbi:hypothetical protein MesoLj131a_61720 [Mesorhizobium sp. 131-2-1]|nr:hypothetical protein MesoLj131a_61720 [Mesorhizobium sp. 131-2-1]BCH04379.1 hypothetical protein MesoLj131b_63780 [Mesorhizobium sp. 131-2-5]
MSVAREQQRPILMLLGRQAIAADLPEIPCDPQEDTYWQIRLRALGAITQDSGSVTGVPGSGLAYSDTVTPELDISYFFRENVAAEVILGTTLPTSQARARSAS